MGDVLLRHPRGQGARVSGMATQADRPEPIDHHEHDRVRARQNLGFASEGGEQVARHPDDTPGAGRRGR